MPATPHSAAAVVAAPAATPAPRFTRDEVQARARAIKKQRKHEGRRLFLGFCASLHALGFSF